MPELPQWELQGPMLPPLAWVALNSRIKQLACLFASVPGIPKPLKLPWGGHQSEASLSS